MSTYSSPLVAKGAAIFQQWPFQSSKTSTSKTAPVCIVLLKVGVGDCGDQKFLQTRHRGTLGSLVGGSRKENLEGHKDAECVLGTEWGCWAMEGYKQQSQLLDEDNRRRAQVSSVVGQ